MGSSRDTIADLRPPFDSEITPVGVYVPSRHDVETLARLAISCSQSRESSEAIEWMWTAMRAAELARMSISEWLTGTATPTSRDYGKAGRRFADGRRALWSTEHITTDEHCRLAQYCLIGAVADPKIFWDKCRAWRLTAAQVQDLARYAMIPDTPPRNRRRHAGLTALASRYGLPTAEVMALRLWW